jgi:hypothetical protein
MILTPEIIIKTTADYFDIRVESALMPCRDRELVKVRQISMYFMRTYTKLSLARIGMYFSGKNGCKNHATVIHSCKTVRNLMETDCRFKGDVYKLDAVFNSESFSSPEVFNPVDNENKLHVVKINFLKGEVDRLKKEVANLQKTIILLKLKKTDYKKITEFSAEHEPMRIIEYREPVKRKSPFEHVASCTNQPYHGYDR